MVKKVVLFIVACVMWLLLDWPLTVERFLLGLLVGFFVASVTKDLFFRSSEFFKSPLRMLTWVFVYGPLMVFHMVRASVRLAFRTLHPNLPASPGIVKVKTCLKTETGLTCLANTITLASGTMTVDVDQEKGVLYVHWVHVKAQDIETATKLIVGRFEPLIKQIFE